MGYGEVYTTILTLESGMNLKHMATESIHGKMEIVMKVNGICVSNMEQAQIYSSTEILTQVNTKTVNHTAKANILGRTVQSTLAISILE